MPHKSTSLFKTSSTTFFNSSRFFPGSIREDITDLYAFVRTVDNYVDTIPQNQEEFFTFYRQYSQALSGQSVDNRIITRFLLLSKKYQFNPTWTESFFNSMKMDLSKTRYNTLKDIETYMYGSASVIGLYLASIMNLPQASYPAAEALGKSFQYLNFIRDLKEDLALGRCYFPQSEIDEFHLDSLHEKCAQEHPGEFSAFINSQLNWYRRWQELGETGFSHIPHRYRVAVKTASDMYRWTARQIKADPFIVYRYPVKPSKLRVCGTGLLNLFSTLP